MLEGALLEGALLEGALLEGALLEGALLEGAALEGAALEPLGSAALEALAALSGPCVTDGVRAGVGGEAARQATSRKTTAQRRN